MVLRINSQIAFSIKLYKYIIVQSAFDYEMLIEVILPLVQMMLYRISIGEEIPQESPPPRES
tara:strand:+ start:7641 stop:7826 length:186 start_codon:yes stop_codon:yes gene_type:complete